MLSSSARVNGALAPGHAFVRVTLPRPGCRTTPTSRKPQGRGETQICRFNLSQELDNIKDKLDFGKKGRLEVLSRFYGSSAKLSKELLEEVMADDFKMSEEGGTRQYTKQDYIGLTAGVVLPAIPDFNWGHATTGELDKDGFCIVTVQANGHHTGEHLRMPNLEPLPPSGKHFCLAEEVQKVKVAGGKVAEIQVLYNKGAGPRALYAALGGKIPAPAAVQNAPPLP